MSLVNPQSLERLVPPELDLTDATGLETYGLHRARYEFAAEHVLSGRVLDIACGVGYGSRIVADRRADVSVVLGVDVAPEAIAYARGHYENARVHFVVGDATEFRSAEPFDSIVSLETIEHVRDPEGFFCTVLHSLRPGGVFVASVPITPSVDANPHHLHDFTAKSFRRLGEKNGLMEVACLPQIQAFHPLRVANRTEKRMADMRGNLLGYYIRHPGAALKRAASTLIHGFNNKYVTIVWKKQPRV